VAAAAMRVTRGAYRISHGFDAAARCKKRTSRDPRGGERQSARQNTAESSSCPAQRNGLKRIRLDTTTGPWSVWNIAEGGPEWRYTA
jgi:hypothetical protein